MVRYHVDSFHVFLMLFMQRGELVDLGLLIHDTLRKFIILLVNPRRLPLLLRVVE